MIFIEKSSSNFFFKDQLKFESERELIQQRAAKQISDLQANVQRLQAVNSFILYIKPKENI